MTASTYARLLLTLSLIAAVVLAARATEPQGAYIVFLWAFFCSLPPLLLIATESEALPARSKVPRTRLGAALGAPWLPGGGRGALFLVLHLVAVFAAMWWFRDAPGVYDSKVLRVGLLTLFTITAVLAPCAFANRALLDPRVRTAVRLAIPAGVIACVVVSNYVAGGHSGSASSLIAQVLNPMHLGDFVTSEGTFVGHPAALPLVSLFVIASIAGNVPRMARSVREVVEQSRR